MKNTFINGSMLFVSVLIILFSGEALSRLLVDPSNYLPLVKDDLLGHRIAPGATGFDKWGFRNEFVPDSADIVTIGDSQTFGINASLDSSWPEQLEEMSHKSVYNLSVGGYGPVQYFHLFKTKALKLKPNSIIVGYFIGNDPAEAFNIAYRYPAWEKLRDPHFSKWLKSNSAENDSLSFYLTANTLKLPSNNFLRKLNEWLTKNSILYRLAFHSPMASQVKNEISFLFNRDTKAAGHTYFSSKEENIREHFSPLEMNLNMDISNRKIQEGLLLTLELFDKINEKCQQKDIEFTVLLIPTKEMVYCHYLFNNEELRNNKAINKLLNNERMMRELSIRYFIENDINFIDALPFLQRKIDSQDLYTGSENGHPNTNGYRLIAKSVFNKIQMKNWALNQ